ncbi:unnamed protein product [Didymodactylos carnosus]|uniref:Uncharacterized protein n=1 Tax=Didymodactylos carnosus TaxID=1234261 RepID=A0A814B9A7_9BILA|nr:unnamed protein product [Didymodactylos carnosus]CAF1323754.1 unnamed protein product [Didymodactylos carnosus]CAF3703762.1 unnamed protein product [Didymodactylos carnosus]CAF4134196.1 unnamed protein product [Didymodactylos carnosus]
MDTHNNMTLSYSAPKSVCYKGICQHVMRNDNEEACYGHQYCQCPHCSLWLCLEHLNQHQQEDIQNRFHAMNDRLNQIQQNIEILTIEPLRVKCYNILDKWKQKQIESINEFHRLKLNEFDMIYAQVASELQNMKEKRSDELKKYLPTLTTKQKSVHPHELELLDTKLNEIQQEIDTFSRETLIDILHDQIKSDDTIKITKEKTEFEKHHPLLFSVDYLNKMQLIRQIHLKKDARSIASSAEHILIRQSRPAKLVLYDREKLLKDFIIDITLDGAVEDLCWSSYLFAFLVLHSKALFSLSPETLKLIRIHEVKADEGHFWSLTTNDTDVFISTNRGFLIQRFSLPSWRLIKQWNREDILDPKDASVNCIRSNESSLIAAIISKDGTWHCDTFDFNMKQMRRGSALDEANATHDCNSELFSLSNNNQWLFLNRHKDSMWLITNDTDEKCDKEQCLAGCIMGDKYLVLSNHSPPRLEIFQL